MCSGGPARRCGIGDVRIDLAENVAQQSSGLVCRELSVDLVLRHIGRSVGAGECRCACRLGTIEFLVGAVTALLGSPIVVLRIYRL
jgi:hypothetical protein